MVERLYQRQLGVFGLEAKIPPDDPASWTHGDQKFCEPLAQCKDGDALARLFPRRAFSTD
jgi:hypothetical protein